MPSVGQYCTACHLATCISSQWTHAFSALTLLVGQQEGHPVCKNRVVGCWRGYLLEQGADLHMAQLMSLPFTVSCFSKIQIGFTFLVPAHPGGPGKGAVKRAPCVCVCTGRLIKVLKMTRLNFFSGWLHSPWWSVVMMSAIRHQGLQSLATLSGSRC